MKYLLLPLVLMLTACGTAVPVIANFPEVPANLLEKCPTLQKIEKDNASIVDMTKTVTDNYTTYYECAVKVDTWNEWYEKQKRIFEGVGK